MKSLKYANRYEAILSNGSYTWLCIKNVFFFLTAVFYQVNGLAIQIFQSIPQFSAMGWFDIDMSLFLQLGDLTFSYYVVLISDLREYVIKSSVTTTAAPVG